MVPPLISYYPYRCVSDGSEEHAGVVVWPAAHQRRLRYSGDVLTYILISTQNTTSTVLEYEVFAHKQFQSQPVLHIVIL